MREGMLMWVLLAQVVFTLFMVGLIWFVQMVHYPLFRDVGRENFLLYEEKHAMRTGFVVGVPMIAEMLLAMWLVWLVGGSYAWAGLLVLLVIWLSTAVWQIPAHGVLARGFDEDAWRRLVKTNWVRTIGWSLRGALAVAWLYEFCGRH